MFGKGQSQMDERQLWVRGNIFKHMFIMVAALLGINMLVQSFYGRWAPGHYESMLILMLPVAAGSAEMIIKDAYQVYAAQQRFVAAVLGLCSGILLVLNGIHLFIQHKPFWKDGMLSYDGASLILAIGLAAIPVAQWVKSYRARHTPGEKE